MWSYFFENNMKLNDGINLHRLERYSIESSFLYASGLKLVKGEILHNTERAK